MSQKLEGDHVYIDALVSAGENGSFAIFDQKFNDTLLQKTNDYCLAIDRFRIPMSGIPLMFFDQTPNAYTVQIGYNGLYGPQTAVQYITTTPKLQPSDPAYWYIYTFDMFILMINNAITDAFNNSKIPLGLPANAKPPFFSVELNTGILSYNAQVDFYDYKSNSPLPIKLFLNQFLWSYMNGIPIMEVGNVTSIPDPSGRDAQMLAFNKYSNTFTYGSTPSNVYYKMESDNGFECLVDWNKAKGFYFRSNNMGVRHEIMPTGDETGVLNNYINGQPIICNFDFNYTQNSLKPVTAQYVLYTPYKIIDLVSSENLRNLDIQIFWYDRYNNSYPLKILPYDAMSIRFIFMKK